VNLDWVNSFKYSK